MQINFEVVAAIDIGSNYLRNYYISNGSTVLKESVIVK